MWEIESVSEIESEKMYNFIRMIYYGFQILNQLLREREHDFYLTVPVRVIWAVKGKDVDLPCDITTTTHGDYPKLILWFKDTTGIPLYRYTRTHTHYSSID